MPMLGKPFFTQKKQPAKINILSGKIEPQITYALRSTRILVGGGKCTCVQVGTTHQSVDEIAENIVIGSKGILSFLNGWKTSNQSIYEPKTVFLFHYIQAIQLKVTLMTLRILTKNKFK